MSNELTVLNFESNEVRMVWINGLPWWVAKDVCRILGLKYVGTALKRLEGSEKGSFLIPTPYGDQMMSIVNESGLNALVLGSRKPVARRTRLWLTSEVIPSIRKKGSYSVVPQVGSGFNLDHPVMTMIAQALTGLDISNSETQSIANRAIEQSNIAMANTDALRAEILAIQEYHREKAIEEDDSTISLILGRHLIIKQIVAAELIKRNPARLQKEVFGTLGARIKVLAGDIQSAGKKFVKTVTLANMVLDATEQLAIEYGVPIPPEAQLRILPQAE